MQEYAAATAETQKIKIEELHDEEENEPEEIQQIPQIKRILPDQNKYYGIKLKVNKKYQNFTIDNGSLVTILPNNRTLYKQKDIQPLKQRYQDLHKIEVNFLEKVWANSE